jgi:hypothetical protein
MREWTGAVLVGPDTQWRVLLTRVALTAGGDWAYTYSFRPGRSVTFVTRPGPGMLDPHDDTYAILARTAGDGYPGSY